MSIARPPVGKQIRIAGKWTLAIGIAASCTAAWAFGPQAEAPLVAKAVSAPQAVAAPGVKPSSTPKKAEAAPALASAAGAPRAAPAATAGGTAPSPQPAPAPVADRVDVTIQLKVNDSREQSIAMKGVGLGDNTASFSSGEAEDRCNYEFRVLPAPGADFYQINAMVHCTNKMPSAPRLVAKLGQPSRIRAGEQKATGFEGFDMTVLVSKAE